jgi:hypothetical protein
MGIDDGIAGSSNTKDIFRQACNIPIWSGCVGTLFQATGVVGHDQAVGMSGYYNIVSDIASNNSEQHSEQRYANSMQTKYKIHAKYAN